MFKIITRTLLLALASAVGEAGASDGVVVIGNANLRQLDSTAIEKVFMGKVIEVGGVTVTAVNASSGSNLRNRFLKAYLSQDEDKYTAYWTVRRYIGKGAPPRELLRSADVINFVNSTPGAIGYIDEADVQPGVNVLLK